MIMKNRKPNTIKITSQVRELGNSLSFLDVLRDTCAHDGRYTLTAESEGRMFTVLVDRGGPFNAIGGGTSGSRALVAAAQLRSGRCTVTLGWPVDQPLYQPGLDLTLRALVDGVVEPDSLPRHRGVESLRNQEWREVGAPTAVFLSSKEPSEVRPTKAAALIPSRPWVRPEAAPQGDGVLAVTGEGERTAGGARHFATQALLWLCEVEDPESYSLQEAASLARKSLVEGLGIAVHPFRREMNARIDRLKQDWEKSGETAARSMRKKRARAGATDADGEFRLF